MILTQYFSGRPESDYFTNFGNFLKLWGFVAENFSSIQTQTPWCGPRPSMRGSALDRFSEPPAPLDRRGCGRVGFQRKRWVGGFWYTESLTPQAGPPTHYLPKTSQKQAKKKPKIFQQTRLQQDSRSEANPTLGIMQGFNEWMPKTPPGLFRVKKQPGLKHPGMPGLRRMGTASWGKKTPWASSPPE